MICSKCGRENPNGCRFCASCGADMQSAQATNNFGTGNYTGGGSTGGAVLNVSGVFSGISNNFNRCFNGVKNLKNMFLLTIHMLILNLIMSGFDLISSEGDYSFSFFKILDAAKDEGDGFGATNVFYIISVVLVALALILMVSPILLGKPYGKPYTFLNYIAMLMVFILSCVTIGKFNSEEYGDYFHITVMGVLYFIETFATAVVTFMFSTKLRPSVPKAPYFQAR